MLLPSHCYLITRIRAPENKMPRTKAAQDLVLACDGCEVTSGHSTVLYLWSDVLLSLCRPLSAQRQLLKFTCKERFRPWYKCIRDAAVQLLRREANSAHHAWCL